MNGSTKSPSAAGSNLLDALRGTASEVTPVRDGAGRTTVGRAAALEAFALGVLALTWTRRERLTAASQDCRQGAARSHERYSSVPAGTALCRLASAT